MEKLIFDRKCKCDYCGCIEICSITHHGTTNYNRLICVECAMSINQNEKLFNGGAITFDLNESTIRFKDFVYDIEKEENEIDV